MKIENYAIPVLYKFQDLKEGDIFIDHDDFNKSRVFMKVPESSLNSLEDSGNEFNAVCLNDGDIYFFRNHDEVEVMEASLTIKPKISK